MMECLPSMHRALGLSPLQLKYSVVVQGSGACGGQEGQVILHYRLHSVSEGSLGHIRQNIYKIQSKHKEQKASFQILHNRQI